MDYLPIRILDPLVENTVVKLQPNQQICLHLSAEQEVLEVDFDSNFFDLISQAISENGIRTYIFAQKYDMTEWAIFSSMYLGEIFVMRKNNTCSSICVILDSKTKPNILTIINPVGSQIKLRPHQILEVVTLGPKENEWNDWIRWKTDISSGSCGIIYEEIKHTIISPKSFSKNANLAAFENVDLFPFPRIDTASIEHHFWYKVKLTEDIWPSGLYQAGKISLIGTTNSGKTLTNVVNINLRIKSKDRKLLLRGTTVKKSIGTQLVKNNWFTPIFEDLTLEPKKIKSLFDGCNIVESDWKDFKNKKDIGFQISK
jgi:hypothetical protein